MDLDDDDDEETIQLKLQQIQAQLRLKKLRKDKAKAQQQASQRPSSQASEQDSSRISRPDSASTMRPGMRIKEIRRTDGTDGRPRSQAGTVEVPASPVRKVQPPPTQTSPSRVLLGIDKGLKGKDISLRRAPSLKKSQDDLGGASEATGGFLRRSRTPAIQDEQPRPLSFSERLAAARTEEKTRQVTRAKAAKSRSCAFNVTMQEMEDYKNRAVDITDELSPHDRGHNREDITGADRMRSSTLQRSHTASSVGTASRFGTGRTVSQSSQTQAGESFSSAPAEHEKSSSAQSASFEAYSGFHLSRRILPHQVVARATSGKTAFSIKDLLRQVKAPDWSLPDEVIDSVVFGIVATKSDPRSHKPQYDAETGKMKPSERGKYMVITLVDLQYEIELFLFNTGFERFWKLSTGTVVAILNPDIMPPPPGRQDTGRFSLTINSDADTILEIGTARDLGYCKSVKADGNLCNSWVNARRTEHCEFHTNTALSRTRSARMEINSTGGLGNGQMKGKGYRSQDRTWKDNAETLRKAKISETQGAFDWDTRSRYFMNGGSRGQSASSLIDRDGIVGDTRERAEGLKRRLAAKEKERDIAKKLGEMGGGGMGGEYMRISGSAPIAEASTARMGARPTSRFGAGRSAGTAVPSASSFKPDIRLPGVSLHGVPLSSEEPQRKVDARSLGLIAPRGSEMNISLSPVKRKRQDSTLSSNSFSFESRPTSSYMATNNANRPAGAFGWGTSLRDKLSRMKTGERLSHHNSHNSTSTTAEGSAAASSREKDRSPVRKKTRFVTDKGIREAGRESLPGSIIMDKHVPPGSARHQLLARQRQQHVVLEEEDDDDDELVVVR